MDLENKKMDESVFMEIREEVLRQWPTGSEVNFKEAVEYQHNIPKNKVFSFALDKAANRGDVLLQPRAGVAVLDEHIKLLRYLEEEGEADLLPTTIDSYTRLNRYKEAEKGLHESINSGRSLLNGFPAVNHGVMACRKVNESVKSPVQIRHGTPDARLLAEICLAGGFTSFEGGGISYNIPYAKDYTLEKTIYDWQYVDRLVGMYEEAGVSINREPFGPLTGTLVPPCISHAVAIIESILAAEQGVKSITVGYGQGGNLIQDVAAIRTLKELTMEYLEKHGHSDVRITTVLHQWMGGFPQDEAKAFAVISWGAATAVLAGADKVITKSPHEALGIPTKEANAQGIKASKQLVTMLKDQVMPPIDELKKEMEIIADETRCIIDKTIELGQGDIAKGTVRAFQAGVIDVPFAPSRLTAGRMMPARDNRGAIRFLDHGDIPFTKDIIDFHKEEMNKRAKYERRNVCHQMVIDDIYAISKGRIVGRPK
jgi:methylaspartate mutase epsilon subunit